MYSQGEVEVKKVRWGIGKGTTQKFSEKCLALVESKLVSPSLVCEVGPHNADIQLSIQIVSINIVKQN